MKVKLGSRSFSLRCETPEEIEIMRGWRGNNHLHFFIEFDDCPDEPFLKGEFYYSKKHDSLHRTIKEDTS